MEFLVLRSTTEASRRFGLALHVTAIPITR